MKARRLTRQRRVVLEQLRKVKTHPTADELFSMVRKVIPSISLGTVYRNLNLLKEEGEILELNLGKYSSRYDGDTSLHYHFFCLRCKKVLDVESYKIKGLGKLVEKGDWLVKYYRVDFYGYCRECKKFVRKEVRKDLE